MGKTLNTTLSGALALVVAAVITTASLSAFAEASLEPVTVDGPDGPVTYLAPDGDPYFDKKIIGANDLVAVNPQGTNIPSKYRSLIDAFGKISMGCTATHIGNGIAITAGHCFRAGKQLQTDRSCNYKVEWGLRKGVRPYMVSKCTKILAMQTNNDTDFAFFTVSPAPTATVQIDLSRRAKLGTPVTIFGHPQGRPLEWSDECTLETPNNLRYAGSDQFTHQCDTEGGNSGSTVIDTRTLKVVGIHDGGIAPWNYGTFLYDTPLRQLLGQGGGSSDTPSNSPVYSFGPFGNNEKKDLHTFNNREAGKVSFYISIDIEKDYDFVVVRQGDGTAKKYTGKGAGTLSSLVLPVTISVETDGSVSSKNITIKDVKYLR